MNRIRVLDGKSRQGMPGFVIRDTFLFHWRHHPRTFLEPECHTVDRFLQVTHFNRLSPAPCGQQCCFVHDIGQISPYHARGSRCDDMQVDAIGQLDLSGVHLQNRFAPCKIGSIHHHLSIKASGP